ncbi:zinc finger (CHY type) protein, putative [Eimeria brunetti]|uniref:Zinc finger (CHY type) protein, putative n=1 Tax=Eimeria brunetti TaxID=51314 RepID=U6LG57_9EIME|nr:zinc finger (CHY type) protein, putative [Eimeria brunetti]
MDLHPKKQQEDTPPAERSHVPSGTSHQPQAQHNGPPEPPDTRSRPPYEAEKKQDRQGDTQGITVHQRVPRNFFIPPSGANPAGPNNFHRRNRMNAHFTFREVKRHEQNQPPEDPQSSQGPPCCSGDAPFSTEHRTEEAKETPERTQRLGQRQLPQQGQNQIRLHRDKGQRQWRSRGGKPQQPLQYVWQGKQEPQEQQPEQQQQQPYQGGQQNEESQQNQSERQQQGVRKQQQDVQQGQQKRLQQQGQQHKIHDGCRQLRRQPLQGQQQKTPNQQQQQQQQQQQKQQEKQQRQPQRQGQQPISCRPVCVRPQLAGGAPAVVVELQRLRRQFSSSFSLLSCHPLLLPLLQQQPYSPGKGNTWPSEAGPLSAGSSRPVAAAQPAERQSSITDWATPNAAAPSEYRQESCRASCGHEALAGRREPACFEPEAASSILCKFELLLVPTDPDFDASMLPCGLRLCVTMGKSYPGAEVVLTNSSGLKDNSGDAAQCTTAATPAANAAAVSEGSADMPEPVSAAKDGLDYGPSDQKAAAVCSPAATRPSGEIVPQAPSTVKPEGGAETKAPHGGSSPSVAVLKVCNEDINDLRRDAIELVFSKVIEQQLSKHENTDLVRTAIKALDRHMKGIFELELTPPGAHSQRIELPWTEEEQKRLEEALVLYRRVVEPTLRWRNISSHVGSRTAKECAIRFQLCRENVLSQRQQAAAEEANISKIDEVEEPHEGTNEAGLGNEGQDSEAQLGTEAGASRTLRGSDISLIDSTTEGVSSLHLSCIQLQVTCGRCRAVVDLRVSLPKEGASMEPAGCSMGCAKCQLRIGIKVQPVIGIAGSQLMRVAVVQPVDCHLKDLLPCDFVLVCDCCGADMKTREVHSGM